MASLEDHVIEVIDRPTLGSGLRVQPWPRWVRAYFAGVPVADSKRVAILLEPKHLPVFYFPRQDVRMDVLRSNGFRTSTISSKARTLG